MVDNKNDIGLPHDWTIERIGVLALDMADGPFGSNLKTVHYTTSQEVRIIQLSNIGDNGWSDANKKYTTFRHLQTISRSKVEPNDVVIAKMMPAGQSILCPNKERGYVLSSDAVKIVFDDKKILPIFFVYSTKSKFFQDQMNAEIQGSTRSRTSITKLKENVVLLPPISEQKRIAEALSDIDELICNLEKLIAKKKDIKQGAMQELLTGKKRLKGFTAKWVEQKFGTLCDVFRGGSPRPIQDFLTADASGVNWIKIGDVSEKDKYIISTEEKIIAEGASCSRMVYKGDFILSNSMSFGRPYILAIDGCIHDGWLTIQNYANNFNLDFLYYLLGSEVIFKQYIKMAAGSGVKNLNKEKVEKLDVRFPENIDEQTAIATILSDMDTEISELEKKLAKYTNIKQGMMQELLTGRIRLPASDKAPVAMPKAKSTNKHFEEVVVLSAIVALFSSEKYPMGRFRRQKFAYLFERYTKQNVDGFLKKPVGPYNPTIRYKDENIAIKSKYVMEQGKGKFVKGEKSEEAMDYFIKWYGEDAITWINQFKYRKNDDLELLTTVAEAVRELIEADKEPTLLAVKEIIAGNSEWKPKLEKDFFNDNAIQLAIKESIKLFHQ